MKCIAKITVSLFIVYYFLIINIFSIYLSVDKNKNCHSYQHRCENSRCVDMSVLCDGDDDCGDNSDETNCQFGYQNSIFNKHINTTTCGPNMFRCKTGTCISANWECDGKTDCMDSSDEHKNCGKMI